MRLRPYSARRDFRTIQGWITDERTHAMWSANLLDFPICADSFEKFLAEREERTGETRRETGVFRFGDESWDLRQMILRKEA